MKGATALIGLGTEAYAHHKQNKERSKSTAPHSSSPMHSEKSDSIYGGNPAPLPQRTLAPPLAYRGGDNEAIAQDRTFLILVRTVQTKTSGLGMQLKSSS